MNQRSSSKQRRPKTTRKKSVARKPLRRWLRTWKRARFRQRLAMILVPLVAVICVTALVVGLTTFVRWRREVDAATAAQDATAQRYGFNPGNIISDGQFFNEHAMSGPRCRPSGPAGRRHGLDALRYRIPSGRRAVRSL